MRSSHLRPIANPQPWGRETDALLITTKAAPRKKKCTGDNE
jgi:hypothetical protein